MGSATYDYQCKVLDVLDGDTVDLSIDLGFDLSMRQRCRLFGLNCPEIHTKDLKEKARGFAAMNFTAGLCTVGSLVMVRSHKGGLEKYGRWLATITTDKGQVVNDELVKAGHAIPWDGQGVKPI